MVWQWHGSEMKVLVKIGATPLRGALHRRERAD